MIFTNWAHQDTDLFVESLKEELKTETSGTHFIASNSEEIRNFRTLFMQSERKKLIEIIHPFFSQRETVEEKNITDFYTFFDGFAFPLINLKLSCKDHATDNKIEYYNYNDFAKMTGRVFMFHNIDLFDLKSQYLLSKLNEHSSQKNTILMFVDIDDYQNHFDKEAIRNSQRTLIVEQGSDNQ